VIGDIVGKNPKAVADFKAGKQAAVGALIGQVMKQVKGADPQTVRTMLVEKLSQ
jgi:aspartyl-tRNA(Asn)/glutamyl-tRNA(Gln) amidotransferase subunit B